MCDGKRSSKQLRQDHGRPQGTWLGTLSHQPLKAWALAEDLAMILADVTRHKADGSILEWVRACYTVRRDTKGWKIVTLSEVKPPFLGPGDLTR